jgi:peptidoglycan/xylan/chitin deacetylase (PgdA/CDA1 family)
MSQAYVWKRPRPWPQSVAGVVWLSLHFDAEAFDLRMTTEDRLFGRFSYGRYGVRAGLPRLLEMFARQSIRITIFVSSEDARRHPEAIRACAAAGHEIASRGPDLGPITAHAAREENVLREARGILGDIAGVAVAGFRAPGGVLGEQTLVHLAAAGFRYDSSFQDSDWPYAMALEGGDRMVEIPTSFALDDSFPFSARHTHARVYKIWAEESEALLDESALVPLILHLRGDVGSSRMARVLALEALIARLRARPGVVFMTGQELADCVDLSGLAEQPDPMVAHRATLAVTPVRGDLSVKPH